MHYVRPRQPKGSHNQSFEISFRRARLKREKSRLGFIIPTIVPGPRSKAQSSSAPSCPSFPAAPFRLVSQLSPFQSPPKLACFLEVENYIHLDACIPPSSLPLRPALSIPHERPMHDIIATKPCHKAVPYHKGLFNP